MSERVVLTMKWGDVFPASYVNRLFSAVSANLEKPFKFVCLTNESEGLHPEIVHFPLPDLDLPPERYAHGAWPKLAVFQPDLYGLSGRCLFIDLDTVISGNLEPFFDFESPFSAIGSAHDWRRGKTVAVPEVGTGIFAFDLGALPHVYESFMADKQAAYDSFPNEQTFVEGQLEHWIPWPETWVVSFKRHLCQPIGLDLIKPPDAPDPSTKVVAFHGDPRPIDLVGRKKMWMKFPHSVRCPIDWLDAYWAQHG
ncbi:MAG: hypothetical protein ABJF50_23105 [Paracoccaceae bacterium]